MTPLPSKPPVKAAPLALLPPVAAAVEHIVRGRGPNPFKRLLFAGASGPPASWQAERALRRRENGVIYVSTGLPLRAVDRAPRRGEYQLHEDRVHLSAADTHEAVSIRYGFPHR